MRSLLISLSAAVALAVTPATVTQQAPAMAPSSPSSDAVAVSTPQASFGWPLQHPHRLVRPFDPPETDYGPGHRGVDLAAPAGQPIVAAGDGVVVYAGWLADRYVISIEHAGGLRTTYEPVIPDVTVGQRVRRGQRIGHLAAGHPQCRATHGMACLHWGARTGRAATGIDYLDPLRLLGHGSVRLLPWRGAE